MLCVFLDVLFIAVLFVYVEYIVYICGICCVYFWQPATSSRSAQEGKGELSQVQSHNVLRIIVDNMLLPVTLDTLYGVWCQHCY